MGRWRVHSENVFLLNSRVLFTIAYPEVDLDLVEVCAVRYHSSLSETVRYGLVLFAFLPDPSQQLMPPDCDPLSAALKRSQR